MNLLEKINNENKNPEIEYIYWKDLKEGDIFPSGETVKFIANWEERQCYEIKTENDNPIIVSDEHIMKVNILDPNGNKLNNFCLLGDEVLEGWNRADEIYNYIKLGCNVFSYKNNSKISINIYKNGEKQKVRCIQTDSGTYEINGIINHNTYLTNYLINKYIRPDERIAIIEEFGELIPPNDLTNNIIIPPAKPGELRLLEFVTEQSNLMRLDAIFVGEIKGKEAWPMVNNMASGTRGSFTMHGDSARQALNRLKALCRLSCDNDEAIDDFIAKSINYIIVMEKRNIKGIYELKGTHLKGNFAMEEFKS